MKKKLTVLAIIAVLTLSMSPLASAASVEPQTCPIFWGACPEPY